MMGLQTCSVETCSRQHLARGLCSLHWQRWKKTGSPPARDPIGIIPPHIRFWSHVDKTPTCWFWTAACDRDGYGLFSLSATCLLRAHHYLAGKPPPGLQWDHLCRRRNCVRPDHLEAVTGMENTRRGLTGKRNRIKTHCGQGHPFDEQNTYLPPSGGRHCKACMKARDRKRISGWARGRAKQ